MRVFLLNPLASIDGRHAHFNRDWCGGEFPTSFVFPPLDLASAAALLRVHKINVSLLDASALHLLHNNVIGTILKERPDYICIPSAWGSFEDDINLCRLIKQKLPGTKIILSGPNVTVYPQKTLEDEAVDYIILGEIETSLLNLVQGNTTHNTAYKKNGGVVVTERALFSDLDSLPFAARDLLPNKKYNASFLKNNPFTSMMTSRGCPYRCTFCQSHIWYPDKVRFRSAKNIADEIEEISTRYKIPQIVFRDLTLTFNKSHLFAICEEILKRNLKVAWRCFSCVDTIDNDTLRLMKRSGCNQISYGIESASQSVLDLSKKGTTVQQAKDAVMMTKKEGIEVCGDFMIGMYGDTPDTIKETIDFALELDPDYVQFQIATPVNTTEFFRQCFHGTKQAEGLRPFRWYNWGQNNPDFSQEYLNQQLKRAYKRFYLRNIYIMRQLSRIDSPRRLYLTMKTCLEMLKGVFFN